MKLSKEEKLRQYISELKIYTTQDSDTLIAKLRESNEAIKRYDEIIHLVSIVLAARTRGEKLDDAFFDGLLAEANKNEE